MLTQIEKQMIKIHAESFEQDSYSHRSAFESAIDFLQENKIDEKNGLKYWKQIYNGELDN